MPVKTSDPLSELEQAAKREKDRAEGARRLSVARSRLVLSCTPATAFFMAIAMRLKAEPTFEIPTAATDGRRLLYNPSFLAALNREEAVGLVCHEAMHVALAHHARREGRDPALWNVAADCAINHALREAGVTLPQGGVYPNQFGLEEGKSAEWYYARLPVKVMVPAGGEGDGEGQKGQGKAPDPGGCGGVIDPGDGGPAACAQAEADAKVMAAAAANAARQLKRGTMPAALGRLVDEILQPAVDWREVLREFIQRNARNDYSWAKPNRRFVGQGIYLPGLDGEELGDLVVAIDTSGSIGGPILDQFAAEVRSVLECNPARLTVLWCDCAIQHVQTWTPGDGDLQLEPRGGGGTSHRPVFDYVRDNDLNPVALVALTDMATEFPEEAPDYPVLWAKVGEYDCTPPFGTVVEIEQ